MVRVARLGAQSLSHEQRVRNELAFRELRLAVEQHFEPAMAMAQRIHHTLHQRESGFGRQGPEPLMQQFFGGLLSDLESDFELGRLIVSKGALPLLGVPPEFELTTRVRRPAAEPPPLPSIARARPPDRLTSFEVRFVDEIGQAISGLDVELRAGSTVEEVPTNPAGIALLEDVESMSASVGVVSIDALEKILEPRWSSVRTGRRPSGVNTKVLAFTGSTIAGISLKAAVPNTVVITPPVGKLFVELLDKTGRVRHAGLPYQISGPQSFSGVTDALGRVLHEGVPAGDYVLKLTVEGETCETPVVALGTAEVKPQTRFLGAVPRVVLARIRRFVFETNKSFLLPDGVTALAGVADLYREEEPCELLVVGHTDTTAQPSINDPLSFERAKNTAAYLMDDVEAWLAMYETSVPTARRWGANEDTLMLETMPDFGTKSPEEDSVRWFQRTRSLEVDGIIGPKTRTQLITEYMAVDGTSLKTPREFDIKVSLHGCGENFPLNATGDAPDPAPQDNQEDALDRRVELFFFDAEFGIRPPPPGDNSPPGSTAYPEWRKAAVRVVDLEAPDRRQLVLEWPELLTPRVPSETILRVTADRTFDIPWSSGRVQGDMRRFVISGFDAQRCSLAAIVRNEELTLWDDQPVDDPENPPVWTHLLEQLLDSSEDEISGSDGVALTVEVPHALQDLS